MVPAATSSATGRLWLTSDLHFGHVNIIAYTGRPYRDVAQMNAGLVALWNETVDPADTVWVLGDVCMGNIEQSLAIVGRLNGTLHLLSGNHDRTFSTSGPPRERWLTRYLDAGFATVEQGITHIDIGLDAPVRACHFPSSGDSHADDRYPDQRPQDDGAPLLHGHTHGMWRQRDLMIDVGVDAWAGRPVGADQLAATFRAGAASLAPLPWSTTSSDNRSDNRSENRSKESRLRS